LRAKHLFALEQQGNDVFWSQFGLIRRSALEQTNLMGTYNGSDQVLLLELALLGELKQVEHELFFRREHAEASTIRKYTDPRELAKFQYADDARIFVLPRFRLFSEHIRCIVGSTLSPWCKVRLLFYLLRRFASVWKDLVLELKSALINALKLMVSTTARPESL
jgi:hypothetical protein